VIEDWAKAGEGPKSHYRSEPIPTRQNFDDFDPPPVPFSPLTIRRAHVHLLRHLFARVWCGAFQDFRIVVVQPFNPAIAIQRIDPRTHPPAEVALTVGVDFDFWLSCQGLIRGCCAHDTIPVRLGAKFGANKTDQKSPYPREQKADGACLISSLDNLGNGL